MYSSQYFYRLVMAMAMLVALAACAGDDPGQPSEALKSHAGAWVGGDAGKTLTADDQNYLRRRTLDTLELASTGSEMQWHNRTSGNQGVVIARRNFKNDAGQYCREYEQIIIVKGKRSNAFGRACRNTDGEWTIVKN